MEQAIIRRKLAAVQQTPPMAESGAARALPLAVARSARSGLNLAIDCAEAQLVRLSLPELLEMPAERSLILLLEGPGAASGVLAICPEMLAGLLEVQTLGRVSTAPLPPRRPTRTDAAMVTDWADAVLTDLEDALAQHDDLVWADGFRIGSRLEDIRPLGLLLEDVPYHALDLRCDLAGARRGRLVLALPAEGRGRRPQRPEPEVRPDAAADGQFTARLADQVLASVAEINASLLRFRLPMGEISGLQPGQILPLHTASLERIELAGRDGRALAIGRLGQQNGMRAVRITQCEGAVPHPQKAAPDEPATALVRVG